MKIIYIALMGCTVLTACGFEPMYGTAFQSTQSAADVQGDLSQIEIGNLPDREGVYLRNALIDRFYRQGNPVNPKYSLSLSSIEEELIDLDITKNSDATRGQLKISTTMYLRDMATGEIVLERPLRSISSYNILTSEFTTRVSEENTRKNALDNIARQIELQIGLYLKR